MNTNTTATIETDITPEPLQYAGFLWRLVAYILDACLFSIPSKLVAILVLMCFSIPYHVAFPPLPKPGTLAHPPAPFFFQHPVIASLMMATQFLTLIIYASFFITSKWKATPGKKILGLQVTDLHGETLGFGRVILREFLKAMNGFILMTGFLLILFTPRSQGLHDLIAKTIVIRNPETGIRMFKKKKPAVAKT